MTLTKDKLIDELIAICDKYPDKVNPVNTSDRCQYIANSDTANRDIAHTHCLFGQFFADRGIKVSNDAGDAFQVFYNDTEDGLNYVDTLEIEDDLWDFSHMAKFIQSHADNFGNPRKWSEVAEFIKVNRKTLIEGEFQNLYL